MKLSNKKFSLPLTVGIFLGAISVIVSQIPAPLAAWSGMRVLANHTGYLLASLIVAYVFSQKWTRSFITSSLTIVIATVVYYSLIYAGGVLELFYAESLPDMLEGLVLWTVIGFICGAISAAGVKILLYGRTQFIRRAVLLSAYLSMLGVILYFIVYPIINFYNNPVVIEGGYLTGYFGGRNFTSDIFESVFAFILVTAIFIAALMKNKKRLFSSGLEDKLLMIP